MNNIAYNYIYYIILLEKIPHDSENSLRVIEFCEFHHSLHPFVVTFAIAKIVDGTIGLRIEVEIEERGLGLSLLGEEACTWGRVGD